MSQIKKYELPEVYDSFITQLEKVPKKKRNKTEGRKKKKEDIEKPHTLKQKRSSTHKLEKNHFAEKVIDQNN